MHDWAQEESSWRYNCPEIQCRDPAPAPVKTAILVYDGPGLAHDVSCAKMPGPIKFIAVILCCNTFSHRRIIDSLK